MKTSQTGRELIEKYEGLILHTYDDATDKVVLEGEKPRGVLTIGYGHTTSAGLPKVFVGQVITKEQADQILASDLARVERDVTNLVKISINQNQFDALVSFHFNTGALGRSSLLKALNAGDKQKAADNFMLWVRAKQIGDGPIPGLVRRRTEEKALFEKPVTTVAHHTTAGAVIVAGGVAASQYHGGHWSMIGIVVGSVILAGLIWYLIKRYKEKTNVA